MDKRINHWVGSVDHHHCTLDMSISEISLISGDDNLHFPVRAASTSMSIHPPPPLFPTQVLNISYIIEFVNDVIQSLAF